ncbi:MAG: glycoside hydrolase family 97 C-terminal domain-containing protein, partial [Bacteroidales bacterium]|nr:glycoside hydrolase family 97 C-terminal domain-containing protein [Bacteroidales bacterium]
GKIADYVAIARRSGEVWYVGAMTDWDGRDMVLDLSFLGEGQWKAEIFRDGVNADRKAIDYVRETVDVPADRRISVHLASGGGCALRLVRK